MQMYIYICIISGIANVGEILTFRWRIPVYHTWSTPWLLISRRRQASGRKWTWLAEYHCYCYILLKFCNQYDYNSNYRDYNYYCFIIDIVNYKLRCNNKVRGTSGVPNVEGGQVPVAYFTKEVNPRLAKRPLVFNGRLANILLKGWVIIIKAATLYAPPSLPLSKSLGNVYNPKKNMYV